MTKTNICNPHPMAPHGYDRTARHNEDRHACTCENWDAWEAGYHQGVVDTTEIALAEQESAWQPIDTVPKNGEHVLLGVWVEGVFLIKSEYR